MLQSTITTTIPKPLEKYRVRIELISIIDAAIHTPKLESIVLPDENHILKEYPITIASNGCRHFVYNSIDFMEQNKKTFSKFAELARNGHNITWGIRPGSWLYVLDNKLIKR